MNPAMMNPEMMKAAQDMMSKMSPEDMQKMMKMQQQMMQNPAMMQQAQQMMGNPAMQQQFQNQMKNMSADDLKRNIDQAQSQLPAASAALPAAPAAPVSAVAKLKASAMSVSEDTIEVVEEAENAKALGNKKFKEGAWEAAAAKYTEGAEAVDKVMATGKLSGSDKKVVYELKEACHLNLANCRLKLSDWDAVVKECGLVLDRAGGASAAGAARKALFRRGDALVQLGKLEAARDDLKAAAKMDPTDTVVAGKLRDVQSQLGEEEEGPPLVEEVEEVDTSSNSRGSSSSAGPSMPSMGGMPTPDPSQMEAMLDNISPEQMEQQMAMLDNLDPAQLSAMGMPGGVDKDQLKMVSNMMKGMDKDSMKSMAKMAAQMRPQMEAMQAAGSAGGGASSSGAAGLMGGMPGGGFDPSNMSLDKGMDMMKNMNPDMMKAGMDMMKNMDPAMMKNMSKMMGRDIDEKQLEQVQKMMSDMTPEQLQKWSSRAQTMAGFASKPIAAYRSCTAFFAKIGAIGVLGLLGALLGVLAVGHVTESF